MARRMELKASLSNLLQRRRRRGTGAAGAREGARAAAVELVTQNKLGFTSAWT